MRCLGAEICFEPGDAADATDAEMGVDCGGGGGGVVDCEGGGVDGCGTRGAGRAGRGVVGSDSGGPGAVVSGQEGGLGGRQKDVAVGGDGAGGDLGFGFGEAGDEGEERREGDEEGEGMHCERAYPMTMGI